MPEGDAGERAGPPYLVGDETVSYDAFQMAGYLLIHREPRTQVQLARILDHFVNSIVADRTAALQSERTAAASEARRETLEECAKWHDEQALTCKPWSSYENILRGVHSEAAFAIRALASTPAALPVTREDGNG